MSVNLSYIVESPKKIFTGVEEFGPARISKGGGKSFRLTLLIGASAAVVGGFKVQHSSGFHLWEDLAAGVNIPVNAGLGISAVDVSTNVLTSVGNAPATGTPVVFTGGVLPGGTELHTIYYAIQLDADTFQLSKQPGSGVLDLTSAGSAPFFVPVQAVHFVWDETSTAGWAPPMSQIRAQVTGTSTQLLHVILTQGE